MLERGWNNIRPFSFSSHFRISNWLGPSLTFTLDSTYRVAARPCTAYRWDPQIFPAFSNNSRWSWCFAHRLSNLSQYPRPLLSWLTWFLFRICSRYDLKIVIWITEKPERSCNLLSISGLGHMGIRIVVPTSGNFFISICASLMSVRTTYAVKFWNVVTVRIASMNDRLWEFTSTLLNDRSLIAFRTSM